MDLFFVFSCLRDLSVRFYVLFDLRKVCFSFDLFKFFGDYDYVFIYCWVYVCDVNDFDLWCVKGCFFGNGLEKRD